MVGQVAATPSRKIDAAPILVLVGLAAAALLVLVSLWVWNDRRGIHVTDAGFRSTGATGTRFFAWRDVDGFGMARRGATWSVTAELKNGNRGSLSSTAGWSWQKASVEQITHQLEAELSEATARANQEQGDVE